MGGLTPRRTPLIQISPHGCTLMRTVTRAAAGAGVAAASDSACASVAAPSGATSGAGAASGPACACAGGAAPDVSALPASPPCGGAAPAAGGSASRESDGVAVAPGVVTRSELVITPLGVPVRKAMVHEPARGYWISTAWRNARPLGASTVSLTCLTEL